LNANRVVSIDRLADELYAGAPPATAVTQVQRQISELRKALTSPSPIETRAPGYVIRLEPDGLDLARFERLAEDAGRALRRGEAGQAAELLREALGLWRGEPLADLAGEPFATVAVQRLEEIRLAALERRIDAELALGRHLELVPELETLVATEPLRERFLVQLMLALYRAGRQSEALDAYRAAREALVEELGIEPAPPLRELERAILAQDPSLDLSAPAEEARALLAVPSSGSALLTIAAPLAEGQWSDLIVARLVAEEADVEKAVLELAAASPSDARVAALTTADAAADVVRLATAYDVELVLLDFSPGLEDEQLPSELAAVLERSPADVAVLTGPVGAGGDGIFVPFGGGEHDWAALELGARLAVSMSAPLRLVGTTADQGSGRRDASRLLADASLALKRVVGVTAVPLLADRGGLVQAVSERSRSAPRCRSWSRSAATLPAARPADCARAT
jgi:DNA-binding SARP family transcriptional activator